MFRFCDLIKWRTLPKVVHQLCYDTRLNPILLCIPSFVNFKDLDVQKYLTYKMGRYKYDNIPIIQIQKKSKFVVPEDQKSIFRDVAKKPQREKMNRILQDSKDLLTEPIEKAKQTREKYMRLQSQLPKTTFSKEDRKEYLTPSMKLDLDKNILEESKFTPRPTTPTPTEKPKKVLESDSTALPPPEPEGIYFRIFNKCLQSNDTILDITFYISGVSVKITSEKADLEITWMPPFSSSKASLIVTNDETLEGKSVNKVDITYKDKFGQIYDITLNVFQISIA